jgi:hypothetical protein
MKRVMIFLLSLSLVVGFAQVSIAQGTKTKPPQKQGEKPGGIVVDAVRETATVAAIDASKRTVNLKFENGRTQTYKLDKAVKNFDQIKVGDKVSATYFESVAVFVRKSGEKPAAAEVQTVTVAPKGAKPGVLITDTFEITAKVEAIDYKMRAVVLKGPEGNMRIFPVDKSVKDFKNVKAGDEVVLRVTEATAIAVEKP